MSRVRGGKRARQQVRIGAADESLTAVSGLVAVAELGERLGVVEALDGAVEHCTGTAPRPGNIFRDAKHGAALRHLPSGYPQVNTAWMWGHCWPPASPAGYTSWSPPAPPHHRTRTRQRSPRQHR
ncbi:MAG: hypothetical protein ACRDSL_09185 [Pseudonocardiaceae bacterium]